MKTMIYPLTPEELRETYKLEQECQGCERYNDNRQDCDLGFCVRQEERK